MSSRTWHSLIRDGEHLALPDEITEENSKKLASWLHDQCDGLAAMGHTCPLESAYQVVLWMRNLWEHTGHDEQVGFVRALDSRIMVRIMSAIMGQSVATAPELQDWAAFCKEHM